MKKIFMCVLTALLAFSTISAEKGLSPEEVQFLKEMEAKDKSQEIRSKTLDEMEVITNWNSYFEAYESWIIFEGSDEQFLFLFETLSEALYFSNKLKAVEADSSRRRWRRQADFSEPIPGSDGCVRYIIYPDEKWDRNKKKY